MILASILWIGCLCPGLVEQAPPPRPAQVKEDVFTRFLNEKKALAVQRPVSPWTEEEEGRLGYLYHIARIRQRLNEDLTFFERLESTRSPKQRSFGEFIGGIKGRLADLDEEELRFRLDGPLLPEIVFPPRP